MAEPIDPIEPSDAVRMDEVVADENEGGTPAEPDEDDEREVGEEVPEEAEGRGDGDDGGDGGDDDEDGDGEDGAFEEGSEGRVGRSGTSTLPLGLGGVTEAVNAISAMRCNGDDRELDPAPRADRRIAPTRKPNAAYRAFSPTRKVSNR